MIQYMSCLTTEERTLVGKIKQNNMISLLTPTQTHACTHLSFSAKSFCNFCSFSRAIFSAWFFRVCSYSRIFSLSAFIVTSTKKKKKIGKERVYTASRGYRIQGFLYPVGSVCFKLQLFNYDTKSMDTSPFGDLLLPKC